MKPAPRAARPVGRVRRHGIERDHRARPRWRARRCKGAASIAGLLFCTEAIVAELPRQGAAMPGGAGGIGRMGFSTAFDGTRPEHLSYRFGAPPRLLPETSTIIVLSREVAIGVPGRYVGRRPRIRDGILRRLWRSTNEYEAGAAVKSFGGWPGQEGLQCRNARTASMSEFDYSTGAELFPNKARKSKPHSLRYRRFKSAADAIRFAIEELPPVLLVGAYLEVDEERFRPRGYTPALRKCRLPAQTAGGRQDQ